MKENTFKIPFKLKQVRLFHGRNFDLINVLSVIYQDGQDIDLTLRFGLLFIGLYLCGFLCVFPSKEDFIMSAFYIYRYLQVKIH